MKNKKEYAFLLGLISLGIVFGILSKAGDVSVQGNFLGNMFFAFGQVSSGVFIWISICTVISVLSINKFWSAINVLFFLAAMILAYYLYSHFIVGYLVMRIVKFWLVMLIPSLVLAFIIWHIKTNKILKYVLIAAGTVIMLFDMFIIQGVLVFAVIIDVVLYAMFLASILSSRPPCTPEN